MSKQLAVFLLLVCSTIASSVETIKGSGIKNGIGETNYYGWIFEGRLFLLTVIQYC